MKELESIYDKYYCSDFYDVSLNCYGVEVGTSLRFWENKGCINKIDPYGWFQWYFRYSKGRKSSDDIRQINRWKRIVSRFVVILKKMVSKGRYSPKIRQILLHWFIFYIITKMNYYWKNREVLLKKAHNKYHHLGGKQKAAEYYQENKEEIKKKERNKYRSMSEDEKDVIRERSKNRYHKNR